MALCPLPSLSSPTPSSTSSDTALTTNHLISIPETLQSLSPPLAALHLARLRLLCDVPASPLGVIQPSKGLKGSGGWCNLCGGLREGLGGAQRGGRSRQQSHPYKSMASSTSRLGSSSNIRTIGGKTGEKEATEDIFSVPSGSSQSQPQSQPNMRKRGQCTTCGALYEKPKPEMAIIKTYGSARRVRKVRMRSDYGGQSEEGGKSLLKSGGQITQPAPAVSQLRGNSLLLSALGDSASTYDIDTATDEKQSFNSNRMDMDVDNIFSSPAPTPMSEEELASFSELINTTDDTDTTNADGMDVELELDFDLPVKPTLFSHPSLAHIPLSSPNLPTYPPPPPKKIQTPTGTSPRKYPAGGAAGVGGKRKKKSGLAKLLAENKEREERSEGGGGLWGLQ